MRRNPPRPNSPRERKAKRAQAVELFIADLRPAEIARRLGVTRQSVSRWFAEWQASLIVPPGDGPHPGSGRRSSLSDDDYRKIDEALRQGPAVFGFTTGRWTIWRVVRVIASVTGVQYHASSAWRVLRHLGWSLREPAKSKQGDKIYVRREWVPPRGK